MPLRKGCYHTMKEIEAKFAVPDRATAERLQTLPGIGRYVLSPAHRQQLHDTYFDTEDRRIFRAGYVLRSREGFGGVVITLKALRGGSGAVRRREEIELTLPAWQPPEAWPDGPMRSFLLATIREATLTALFDLRQERQARMVTEGDRRVAEWSVDAVRLERTGAREDFFVLEIELRPDGTESDLREIVRFLRERFGLRPDRRTKLQHAQAFFAAPSRPAGGLLSPDERIILQAIASRNDRHGRHAKALLALHERQTQRQAAQLAGLSERRVRFWLAQWRRQRSGIFPSRVIDEALPPAQPFSVAPRLTAESADLAANPAPVAAEVPLSIPLLLQRHGADQRHARAVAAQALALFDALATEHGLPPVRRTLLERAALLHDVGFAADPKRHHTVGRDILLQNPVAELNRPEQQMVALTTFLHRKRMTAKKLEKLSRQPLFAQWSASLQRETLVLAALLRMADGLDFSRGGSRIDSVRRSAGLIEINIAGPEAAVDAARARAKADLWALLFPTKIVFHPPMSAEETLTWRLLHPSGDPETDATDLPDAPGITADDFMAEAARKIVRFHFWRMLYHEPAVRATDDADALHDMRVATRRMRVAFHVLSVYIDVARLRPFGRMLRRTGRALGQVRDLDVFWEYVERYLRAQSQETAVDLRPLRSAWEKAHAEARARLLAFLGKPAYQRFKEDFAGFVGQPWKAGQAPLSPRGEAIPRRVRHLLPVLVAERQAHVLAYGEWLPGDVPLTRYHRLRIAAKYFRYTLEYFREVLGPGAKPLIKSVVALQDHLGQLQDTVVASGTLRDFLTWGDLRRPANASRNETARTLVVAPDVAVYLASRQKMLQQSIRTFPAVWNQVDDPAFRRQLAELLSPL